MDVRQIYEIMNTVTGEILGDSVIVNEDLSNIVDVGTAIFNASAIDNYVKSLVNHIGRVIFVNRPYSGNVPSVLMDGWEYGSVLEKISAELPTQPRTKVGNSPTVQAMTRIFFISPRCPLNFSTNASRLKFQCRLQNGR